MRREAMWCGVWVGMVAAGCFAAWAQAPAPAQAGAASGIPVAAPQTQESAPANGGRLHGVVKSGNTPLPGVTVTAQNTLTGKRTQTITDIAGAWSFSIQRTVATSFAHSLRIAQGSQEAVLNAASHDQTVSFDLMLASRAALEQKQQDSQAAGQQVSQAIQQITGTGSQSLSLVSALAGNTDTQSGTAGASGAALPSVAGNSDFSGDSVAISGQAGAVSPMAGLDMDRIRDAIETVRTQIGGAGGGNFGGAGGALGGLFGGGGFGGQGGGGGGFGGGGRGNFRGFNPGQPHGAIFWIGSNSALNAEPFSLRGQPQEQPASGTNRFGITFMSAPYIPHLTKPSGKDTVFLTLSGTRSSTPQDQYATVPTDGSNGTYNQRAGDFTGQPAIYDPVNDTTCVKYGATPGQPFPGNMIPTGCIAPPATALLLGTSKTPQYFPAPNLTGAAASNGYNYHLLTTAQSNSTQAGARYMRSIGKNATQPGAGGRGGFGGGRRNQNQGLRQSINFNYNWSDSASDNVNLFPLLGGKTASNANSVQGGYTVGYHKITSVFNASWNRSTSQRTNYFTGTTDIATQVGVLGPGGGIQFESAELWFAQRIAGQHRRAQR